MKLGEIIAGYRLHKGQSLEALAGEIGIDPVSLFRMEQGKFATSKQWPEVMRWVFSEHSHPPTKKDKHGPQD